MALLETWVVHENIMAIARKLSDPALAGDRTELLRQLSEQRAKLSPIPPRGPLFKT